MIYLCCDERRRNAVRGHPLLNGIDFLEVVDGDALDEALRQRTLLVRLFKAPPAFVPGNVRIDGGERIPSVGVEWVARADSPPVDLDAAEASFYQGLPAADRTLVIRTDSQGDFSTYTLRLVGAASVLTPPPNFDPLLSRVEFSFKVECPSDFDCDSDHTCPPEELDEPEIRYLAKDYGSFRRLMLDRIAQLVPGWRERSPADLGVALVELLAYVGDHLSYQQDAVATEAYLGTARRRVSVRRHARLVDYRMHDGANARVWVQIRVKAPEVEVLEHTQLFTRVLGAEPVVLPTGTPSPLERALESDPIVFETVYPVKLFSDLNELFFYTWGDEECCLPAGATRATLRGHHPRLEAGQILVFEETKGPETGAPEDADPTKRAAVRLVEVVNDAVDPLGDVPISEIRWHHDDALTLPLCISSRTGAEHGERLVTDVSRALGNIVLADHGRSVGLDPLGSVPEPHLFRVPDPDRDRCDPTDPRPVPPRFRPKLDEGPITQAGPFQGHDPPAPADPAAAKYVPPPARDAMIRDLASSMPEIGLVGTFEGETEDWEPRRDLLGSDAAQRHFVVEVESDGSAWLRFGDDHHGMRPQSGTVFDAWYRVGNGGAGNVGADSIAHVASSDAGVESVRNPLPAQGGVERESVEEVRKHAPFAFRTQERAVTPEDYEEKSRLLPSVQRAAATFRWTGSWHTVFVTADRFGGLPVTEEFETRLRAHLEQFRMAGYDLEVDGPRFVSLEIDLFVCAAPDYFRSDVKDAVVRRLGRGLLLDGTPALFHPDNFTFGTPMYLSTVVAAAQSVPGVDSVEVRKFQRQGVTDPEPREAGRIELGRLEIARLDNDPDFPEHGVLRVQVAGGK